MAIQGLVMDKVVVVTGAGGGIGREVALLMARQGAKVVVPALKGSFVPMERSGDVFSWDPV